MVTQFRDIGGQRTRSGAASSDRLPPAANDGDRRAAVIDASLTRHLGQVFVEGVVGVVRGSISRGPDWANPAFLQMSGYGRADLDAHRIDWLAMTPPEWHALDRERLAVARLAGYSPTYEKEFLRRDGSRWPVIVGYAIDVAAPDLVTVFVVDLTASRLAETARRDASRHFARFFEIANVAFWTCDAQGRVTFSTKTTADRLGTDEVLDNAEAQAMLIHPDDRAYALATWERALGDGKAYDIEVRARSYDGGDYLWTRLQSFPDTAHGHVTGWYGTSEIVHERRLASNALVESEARFKRLADDVPMVIWLADQRIGNTYLSKGWTDFTGQTCAEALGFGWAKRVHPEDLSRLAVVPGMFQRREAFDLDYRVRGRDGDYRWMLSSGRPRFDGDGALLGYAGCLVDIHARKTAERELAAMQQRLASALDGTGVGVWEWEAETDTVVIGGSALSISGFKNAEPDYQQVDYRAMIHDADRPRLLAAMEAYVAGTAAEFEVEVRIRTREGGWVWVLDRGTATERDANGRARRLVGTLTNIEDAKRAETKLRWTVEHDALTGLANRTLFQTCLDAALATGGPVALALLDIDEFKSVNDVLGHAAGDALLVVLAERLSDFAYPGETVARLGGDEFTLLMPGCGNAADVLTRLEALRVRLTLPFVHDGKTLTCRSSIGVTLVPDHGRDASALLKNADIAMYNAKTSRRGAVALFEPALGAVMRREVEVLDRVRSALDSGDIQPFYDPAVSIADGSLIGFEAVARIMRCDDYDHGICFGAALQDPELTLRLGERILDQVIADITAWRLQGVLPQRVAVNVAAAELRRGDYAERLLERLERHQIPPSLLCVEVVETVLLGRGAERSEAALATLARAGVHVALDHFGTGYASLTHLTRLQLRAIKIDRSFVAGVDSDQGKRAIVRAITALGTSFDLRVIAEGVETAAQAAALVGLGCGFAQGNYFYRAQDAAAMTALLKA